MEELVIQTQRLTLRPITLNDLNEIHRLHILPETDEFNALGIPKDLDETQSVITPWVTANNQKEVSNYTFAILHQKTSYDAISSIRIFGRMNFRYYITKVSLISFMSKEH